MLKKGLPDRWRLVKLKEVAKIDNKAVSPEEMRGELQNYIGLENIESNTGQLVSFSETLGDDIKSNKFGFTEEHILYGKLRPYLNKVYLPDFAGVCSTDIIPIKPNRDLLIREFLGYFLRTPEFVSMINAKASGANLPRVNPKALLDVYIPLPPIETQRKIVAILEKAEATQRLRAEADALMQDLLQSVFLEMFGDPSIKSTNWPYERLGNVIGVTSGHGFKLEEYSDDGIRLLRINNVSFGDIIWEQVAYLPFEYGDKFPHLVLKKDDILMALNRPILGNKLKVGMMDEEDAPAILYQRVGRIDILDEERVNRLYLFHLLRTRYFLSELSARLSGSDQPYINPTAMVKIKIPLPPIAIQKRFAQIAANIQLTYDTGQSSRNQLQTLFQVIIDRAFTGDLIP